jgi:DedD protein
MAESQEIGALRRRGRRRLVGAIALVLLAVIVLPMVFDSEPRQGAPAVSVRIPSEDDAGFSPKATPKAPVTPVAPKAVPAPSPAPQKTAPAPAPKAEGTPEEKPAPQAAAKPPGADAERQRAEAAISGEQFTVPVAALANAEKVKELVARLTEAKLPYYTEAVATAQGSVTRVRVGPFADRATAEKAMQRLKTLGLKPGNVTGKS